MTITGVVVDDFKIADLGLARLGRKQVELALHEMPGLLTLRRELAASAPLKGARITGSLHMTVQTAVLVETLVILGAQVRWSGCNILSTQDEAAAAVVVGPDGCAERPSGVPVFARKGQSIDEYWWCIEKALRWPDGGGPNLLLDDGGDATLLLHEAVAAEKQGSVDGLSGDSAEVRSLRRLLSHSLDQDPRRWATILQGIRGVTEETTAGVRRLSALHEQSALLLPAINVNDSVTKSKFDNRYGCRHSLIDGLNRATDLLIGGKTAVVCGYGDVGKGCAQALRGQGSHVLVTEVDPICALQASMDGFPVVQLDDVLPKADIVITATGCKGVVTADQMARMKHLAVVGNIGHFDVEIDVAGLATYPGIRRIEVKPQVTEWAFPEGHSVIVLSEGRILNLGNATGHPSFVMSTSFSNQILAQIELHTRPEQYAVGVHRLPKLLDERVARMHLEGLGAQLTPLTSDQADYLGVTLDGPYKPDHYRY